MNTGLLRASQTALLVAATAAAGCGAEERTGQQVAPACAGYEAKGPYVVGQQTFIHDGEPVEVWYPAVPGSEMGLEPVVYDLREWLPEDDRDKVSDDDAPMHPVDAYRDLPASTEGPYPLVLFSHGLSGYRMQSTFLMTHLASWGMVVVAPEHPERGLAQIIEDVNGLSDNAPTTLRTLYDRYAEGDAPLSEAVDANQVGLMGHSAGSAAVVDILVDPETTMPVSAWISMAGGGVLDGMPPEVPSLLLAGTTDEIANLSVLQRTFGEQPAPKTFVALEGAGHLAFSDICLLGEEQGGLVQVALDAGIEVPEFLPPLAADGCRETDTPVEQSWPAIRHYAAATLLQGFDRNPVEDAFSDDASACFAPHIATFLTEQ